MEIELWRPPPDRPQYVADFMNSLERKEERDKIMEGLERLKYYGLPPLLRTKEVKKIEDGLFEIRSRYGKRKFRIMFCCYKERYWLLSGFVKKTQKTPPKEIRTAANRMRELKNKL
ncbi:type II toxin-antitoxin system RelE/ParE family toxin [Patescibacteria group bacterium]|nr:type II toxin-antitoxin system RelE/ParE family toxin [Patescibacteria group bacterium]MBP9710229.1 type II toxin-antitoxin system RelE/ParE family toxin [Patescibacteria group bacterium]